MEFQEEQFIHEQKITRFNKSVLWFFLLIVFSAITGFLIWKELKRTFSFLEKNSQFETNNPEIFEENKKEKQKKESSVAIPYTYSPVEISMSNMKKKAVLRMDYFLAMEMIRKLKWR